MDDRDSEEAMAVKVAVMASSPEDHKRFGLSPASIEPWEDEAIWELMYFGHAR